MEIKWQMELHGSATVTRNGQYFGSLFPRERFTGNVTFVRQLSAVDTLHVDIWAKQAATQIELLAKYLP